MNINTEKILRKIPIEEKIFRNTRRVSVIKAVECIIALSKTGLETQSIKDEIKKLLDSYKIVRVQVNEKDSNIVDLAISKTVNASDYYMWTEEKYDYMTLLYSILGVILVLGLVMYRIWPIWLKIVAKYVQYVLFAGIIALIILAVIRLIIFSVTYLFCKEELWIFPNLFEECGFIESFKPMYLWGNAKNKKKE